MPVYLAEPALRAGIITAYISAAADADKTSVLAPLQPAVLEPYTPHVPSLASPVGAVFCAAAAEASTEIHIRASDA